MKKRWFSLLLLLVAASLLFSCQPVEKPPVESREGSGSASREETETTAVPMTELANPQKTNYTVVLASDASNEVLTASKALIDAFGNAGAAQPNRAYDNAKTYKETACEILVGLTNRAASASAYETLESGEISISFAGKKLVVAAANDALLSDALNLLPTLWSANGGKITIPENCKFSSTAYADGMIRFLDGNKFVYTLVYQSSLSADMITAVGEAATSIKKAVSVRTVTNKADTALAADPERYEILIGDTDRGESADAQKRFDGMGYRMEIKGKKIVLVASNDQELQKGLNMLVTVFSTAYTQTKKGEYLMKETVIEKTVSSLDAAWYLNVPKMEMQKVIAIYNDSKSCMTEKKNGTAADYTAYIAALKDAGFEETASYTQDQNRYALLSGADSTVYAEYFAPAGKMNVYIEKKGLCQYPAIDETPASNAYTPVLWQLPIDCLGSMQNGGMSYVLRLGDGTFFVIDGGYPGNDDANRLFNVLNDNAPAGQKPVVSGWLITHLHGDHFGALQTFAQKYADQVDVKAFYYQFAENSDPIGAMNVWQNAKHYGRMHTGMEWNLGGVNFSVIFSHEDILPAIAENPNDASTVVKITANGQKIMILGDIMKIASDRILANQSAGTLKASIVQFAHHGYEGATKEIYDAIGAETVLWPMNLLSNQESYGGLINCFKTWMNTKPRDSFPFANFYVVNEMTAVKKIIVSGAGLEALQLPYTPTGAKLPDYDAIYQQQLAEYQNRGN